MVESFSGYFQVDVYYLKMVHLISGKCQTSNMFTLCFYLCSDLQHNGSFCQPDVQLGQTALD